MIWYRPLLSITCIAKQKPSQYRPRTSKAIMALNSTESNHSKRPDKVPTKSTTLSSRDSKSVYDRLYKTSTVSSKARKEVAPVVQKNILMRENEEPPTRPSGARKVPTHQKVHPKKVLGQSENDEVFNRLYQKGTASSTSKRSNTDTVSRAPMRPKNHHWASISGTGWREVFVTMAVDQKQESAKGKGNARGLFSFVLSDTCNNRT